MFVSDLVQMINKLLLWRMNLSHKDIITKLHHYQEFGNNYQINGLVSTPLHYQHDNGLINYEIMRYDTATDTSVDHNNSVFLYW